MKKSNEYNYFVIKDLSENYPEGTKPFPSAFADDFYPDACYFANALLLIRTKDDKQTILSKINQSREKHRHNLYRGLENYKFIFYDNDECELDYPSEKTKAMSGKEMWHFLKTVIDKKYAKEKQKEKQLTFFE